MRKQNGITLIALIITIIVLLILAGVTINLVVGQNGVLGKAQSAVSETKVAEAKQSTELLAAGYKIEWYQNGLNRTQEKAGDYVKKKFEENVIIDSKYYIQTLDSDSGDENNPNRPFVLRLGTNMEGTIIASGYITDDGDILWDKELRINIIKVYNDPLALAPGIYTINTNENGNEYTLEQTWEELDESKKINYVSINYKDDKTLLSSISLEKSENRRCLVIDDTITTIFSDFLMENDSDNIDEIVFPISLKKIDDNAICSPITPYFKEHTTFYVGANNNFENLNYNDDGLAIVGDGVLLEVQDNVFLPQIDDSFTIKSIAGGVFTGLSKEQKENCYCPGFCNIGAHCGTFLTSIDKSLLERYFKDLIYIGSNNFNYMELSNECTIDLGKIDYLGTRTFVNCKGLKLKYENVESHIVGLDANCSVLPQGIYGGSVYSPISNVISTYAEDKGLSVDDTSKIFYCDHLIVEVANNSGAEEIIYPLHSAFNDTGECDICGTYCNHQKFNYWDGTYETNGSAVRPDGTCRFCNAMCSHQNGQTVNEGRICNDCGFYCGWHQVDPSSGICTGCNYQCSWHNIDPNGYCSNCQFQCPMHSVDLMGYCVSCGATCMSHSIDSNGYCFNCGFQCPNHSDGNEDSNCDTCNSYISMW